MLISSLHQVARDIDSHYIGSQFRGRQCRSPIAASQIENLHPFVDSETLHKRVAAFAHCFGNPCEITFFPECFVWIHFELRLLAGLSLGKYFQKSKPDWHSMRDACALPTPRDESPWGASLIFPLQRFNDSTFPDSILLGVHCLPTAISPHKHIGENRPVHLLIFTSLARTFLVCCQDNASDNADIAIDAHSQLIEVLLPVRRRRMRR